MRDTFYEMFRRILTLMLKTLITVWYATDRDKDNLICWSIGQKHSDHDFTLMVNRY